jgi:hypothetical protein
MISLIVKSTIFKLNAGPYYPIIEFLHKCYTTTVGMATMTFEHYIPTISQHIF